MKVTTFIEQPPVRKSTLSRALERAEVKMPVKEAQEPVTPDAVESVIFPASDRFKHMMSLIARDNPMLYNRIVGLE